MAHADRLGINQRHDRLRQLQQANQILSLIHILPAFIFPGWLQRLSLWVPTRWAVDGFDAMTWRAQPFEAALAPAAVMLGWSLLFVLIAVWRFDWDAE